MYPHRIRLRGPWEAEPAGQPPGRLVLPCPAGETGLSGPVRFRRRFGYPGQIDAHERVWLVLEGVPSPARLLLNGVAPGEVGSPGDHELDVTTLLRPRNELTIDLDLNEAGLWREVALEVRCLAYLRDVCATVARGVVQVTGEVVGPATAPLELYLIIDRSPAGYRVVSPSPAGQPFELTAAASPEGVPARVAKIELVNGAVVWYTSEVDLSAPSVGGA